MPTPVVALDSVELVPRPDEYLPTGPTKVRFDAARALLGPALGLTKIGVNVTQVAPGCAAYPFHSHRANDELFLVLAGSGVLRLGAARHAVKAGDLIACPAGGPETAHQLVNTGEQPLRYLALATTIDPEICEYPDSGKIGAYAGDDEQGLAHLSRHDQAVDYWDGE